jgi:hypothetical protein
MEKRSEVGASDKDDAREEEWQNESLPLTFSLVTSLRKAPITQTSTG